MNSKDVLIKLQSEIDFCKKRIAELTHEERQIDKVFYHGILQAYENMNYWLKNLK